MSKDVDQFWNQLMRHWWGHWCVAGFFFFGVLAIWLLSRNWEAAGGVEPRGIVTFLYSAFGKWFFYIVFGLAGIVFTLTGLWKLIGQKDDSRPSDQ